MPSRTLVSGTVATKLPSVNVTERRPWPSRLSVLSTSLDVPVGILDLRCITALVCARGVISTVVVTTLALTFVSRTGFLSGEPGNMFAPLGGETAQAYSTEPAGDLGALMCTDSVEPWRLGMLTSSGSNAVESTDLSGLERLLLLARENWNSLPLLTTRLQARTWAPEHVLQEPALKLRQA